ncbi:MAG: hypothetical protein Q7J38_08915 [Gallionella sp.]|nr:hypothetical protein [Gallionella sp.]
MNKHEKTVVHESHEKHEMWQAGIRHNAEVRKKLTVLHTANEYPMCGTPSQCNLLFFRAFRG